MSRRQHRGGFSTRQRCIRRAALDIIRHLHFDSLTYDEDGDAGIRLYESGRPTWYHLDATSVRAICWNRYRRELHDDAAVTEAVRLLTERARRAVRHAA